MPLRGAARAAWLLVTLAAAAALAWNDLFLASQGEPEALPVIPIFDWAFTSVPAFLGGALAVRRGVNASLTAALGTAVVTLPLLALGGTLLRTESSVAGALLRGIPNTLIFGIIPLAAALILVKALASRIQPPEPTQQQPDVD